MNDTITLDTIPTWLGLALAALAWIAYAIVVAVQSSRDEKQWAAIEARYDADGVWIGNPESGGSES